VGLGVCVCGVCVWCGVCECVCECVCVFLLFILILQQFRNIYAKDKVSKKDK